MTRIAILDDYVDGALAAANWDSIYGAEVEVFTEHLGFEEAKIAEAIEPFEIIVAMRERTPFSASLLSRLPNLKLLITTGMRNLSIDMEAARVGDIDVCGTDMLSYPAFEHTWALILAVTGTLSSLRFTSAVGKVPTNSHSRNRASPPPSS